MDISFDPDKDISNQAKHGVSLADVHRIEWDMLWAKPDTRRQYGEARMIGYAPIEDRVYCVVYTDRGDSRRIISLRKANNREIKRYASEI
ncbi:BrnT family toxin [Methylomonas sp. MgM2]